MIGADEYYNLIYNANSLKLGNLRRLNCSWNGGDSEAYINNNVIYVTSSHARGKCFYIYLVEDINKTDKELRNNAFEVYGVTGGQCGWTETYGWLYDGAWVDYITKYLNRLDEQIKEYIDYLKRTKELKEKANNTELKEKLEKFNNMFM